MPHSPVTADDQGGQETTWRPLALGRYADAFATDGIHGSRSRCARPVNWARLYDTRDRTRHRVWSCDGHTWIERTDRTVRAGRL